MNMIGSVEAVHGVTVSADLAGSVERISFESGQSVRAGDVLVELDTRQERAQLASLEAQRDLARVTFGRMQQLVNEGVISRVEYDQASTQQRATEANVAEIRATIERKTIRAPFSGILGIRKVNLGQYLSSGSPVVPLQSLNPGWLTANVASRTSSWGSPIHHCSGAPSSAWAGLDSWQSETGSTPTSPARPASAGTACSS